MSRGGTVVDRALPVGSWGRSELTDAIIDAVNGTRGYRLLSVGIDRVSFARSLRPRWATVAAIVTAPTIVGLLFLLVRTTESFTCVVLEDHSGIHARVHGKVHPALLAEIEALSSRGPTPSQSSTAGVWSGPPGITPLQTGGLSVAGSMATPSPFPGSAAPVTPPTTGPFLPPAPPPSSAPIIPRIGSVDATVGPPAVPVVEPSAPIGSAPPWSSAVGTSVQQPNDSTRIVRPVNGAPTPPSRGSLMRLRFEDGRTVEISGFALVGRNPSTSDSDPDANLIVIDHDTVSKTHLAVGVSDGVAWVADRHSTNGSAIVDLTGGEAPLVPGERVRVEQGSAVRLGTYWVKVERVA